MSDQHDRPDDRMGLEAFDAVDAPDQWDDITRRAEGAEVGSSSPVGKRRSPATWFMAAAAVALVAVAAVAVSVRSGDDSAPTPATTPDETLPTPDTGSPATTSPTTEPATTIVQGTTVPPGTAPVTTTVATTGVPSAPVSAWDPDCVDRLGDPAPSSTIDDVLTQFTTLGTEPSLDIAIPTIETSNGVEPPLVSPVVVPGGVALTLYGYTAGDTDDAAAVVVVDDDGSTRWRRCFEGDGVPTGLLSTGDGANTIALVTHSYAADTTSVTVRYLDLASGDDIEPPQTRPDVVVGGVLGEFVLLQQPWQSGEVAEDAELVVLDVGTGETTAIPYPDAAVGSAPDSVYYELVGNGDDVLIAGTTFNTSAPSVVWTGDSWSSEPDDLRQLPPRLRIPFGNDVPLQLLDGAGDVVWEVEGFHTISREGFNNAIADSVVLVMECLDWTDDVGCQWLDENTPPREQLAAFELDTGERLWSRAGGQAFAAIDGDRGIVTAEEGWELIDLRTGERVDDQPVTAWPQDDIFANECCGAGDFIWTRLDGGVLFESTGDRLRVWLPPEVSTPTVTTDAFSRPGHR